ncbi:lethal(3)malignant brain tumor-like protein 4 [Sturnira hondurensis]|uniref:lethal(3)malignant brain tumor-like protein 4 n=1 Tax=Sturnira hondurensis TaxID=192404 RepID=UPI00187B0D58|nr:lethal(3)malignant brain tumor-like protein 4 [Sturnira hondurensis]
MLTEIPSAPAPDTWSWDQYLKEQNALAAPIELFSQDQSFPEYENGFHIGMRLEGIDPRHPAVFCVLSVAEVCGYRLRLHFDGYLSCYDFWTNAGSPDLHPIGWCEKTKHELHIPKGYRKDKFVWMNYLKAYRLQNAPKKLFRNRSSNGPVPKDFRVGMKLEAVDRKNPSLVCVATIADIVEDRLLVHFDNWDDSYDYWCGVNSPHIQPVGWCQKNGRTLITPQGYPDPENFSWTEYLDSTQTSAVPAKVFKMRLPHGFLPNMKLEVVDKRNPRLIRVATIVDVDDQRIKIHFDGWDHKYDYWTDADSPDIHPIGWCDVTGHPLEAPCRANDVKTIPGQAVCPTPGCRGIGHIRGPKYSGHHSAFGCPYSDMNLKKEATLHDRLREQTQENLESDSSHLKLKSLCSLNFSGKHEKANSQHRLVQQTKCLKIKQKEDFDWDKLFRGQGHSSGEPLKNGKKTARKRGVITVCQAPAACTRLTDPSANAWPFPVKAVWWSNVLMSSLAAETVVSNLSLNLHEKHFPEGQFEAKAAYTQNRSYKHITGRRLPRMANGAALGGLLPPRRADLLKCYSSGLQPFPTPWPVYTTY